MALPPLHAFRVFECVARVGNVAAAAVELHVTPGAVSQQIRGLQSQLEIELFQRKGRQLVLTESGVALHRSVTKAMGEIRRGVLEISEMRDKKAETVKLTISIPRIHGISWLATRLFSFIEDNRHISVEVITASLFQDVNWKRADLAIVYGSPPWPGFWWRLLHGIKMTPVCSPQLLRGPTAIRAANDLLHHRLLHEDDGAQWRRWLLEARVPLSGQSEVHFQDFGMVLQAARDGFGVALSDEIVSARDLDNGSLVQPLALTVPALHNYYCICNEESHSRPEVTKFIDWLYEQVLSGR